MSIQLGDKCKDLVTGYEGVVVARTEWLNGCIRVTLQCDKLDKDGKPQDTYTFDEPQLVVLKTRKVAIGSRDTGGPVPNPQQHRGPTR